MKKEYTWESIHIYYKPGLLFIFFRLASHASPRTSPCLPWEACLPVWKSLPYTILVTIKHLHISLIVPHSLGPSQVDSHFHTTCFPYHHLVASSSPLGCLVSPLVSLVTACFPRYHSFPSSQFVSLLTTCIRRNPVAALVTTSFHSSPHVVLVTTRESRHHLLPSSTFVDSSLLVTLVTTRYPRHHSLPSLPSVALVSICFPCHHLLSS